MITLQQYLEAIDYRITESADYTWQCYGHNAAYLDGFVSECWSASAVFDRKTQTVYEAQICDYRNNRCYRLINPEYRAAHASECQQRDVGYSFAWDNVKWCDLETDEDWLEKTIAIVEGRDYDTTVQVPLDLDDATLLVLCLQAHQQDITLNQLINNLVKSVTNESVKN